MRRPLTLPTSTIAIVPLGTSRAVVVQFTGTRSSCATDGWHGQLPVLCPMGGGPMLGNAALAYARELRQVEASARAESIAEGRDPDYWPRNVTAAVERRRAARKVQP